MARQGHIQYLHAKDDRGQCLKKAIHLPCLTRTNSHLRDPSKKGGSIWRCHETLSASRLHGPSIQAAGRNRASSEGLRATDDTDLGIRLRGAAPATNY